MTEPVSTGSFRIAMLGVILHPGSSEVCVRLSPIDIEDSSPFFALLW
jgi:hypothetical protein